MCQPVGKPWFSLLWCLTRSSSLHDDVITHLGGGEHLTWQSEPVSSGEGGHCGIQEMLCLFTQVLSLWGAVLGPTAG